MSNTNTIPNKEKEIYRMKISKRPELYKTIFELAMLILLIVYIRVVTVENQKIIIGLISVCVILLLLILNSIYKLFSSDLILTNDKIYIYKSGHKINSHMNYKIINNIKENKTIILYFSIFRKISISAESGNADKFISELERLLVEKYPKAYKKRIEANGLNRNYSFEQKLQFAANGANGYYLKNSLMDSRYEEIFFDIINGLIRPEYIVIPHVSLREIFTPKDYEKLGQLSKYHVDFLICHKEAYKPVCAVEINGATHNEERQIIADTFKKALFDKYSIPYISFDNEELEDESLITDRLNNVTLYSIYCRHDKKNNKMIYKGNDLYKCPICGKSYICRELIK